MCPPLPWQMFQKSSGIGDFARLCVIERTLLSSLWETKYMQKSELDQPSFHHPFFNSGLSFASWDSVSCPLASHSDNPGELGLLSWEILCPETCF